MTTSYDRYRNNTIRIRAAVDKELRERTGQFSSSELASAVGKVRGREMMASNVVSYLKERDDVVYIGHGLWERRI